MTNFTLVPWLGVGASFMTGLLGLFTLAIPPRSVARLSFAAGMLLLTLESILTLLSIYASTPLAAITYQHCRLGVSALLPGTWLVFSLHYARGRRDPLPGAWKSMVTLAFVLPFTILLFPGASWWSGELVQHPTEPMFQLGWRAVCLHVTILFTLVFVIVNIEQTFRGVTGTMRWRIKFLLLGLGIILLTSFYTSGWAVLNHSWPYSHDIVRLLSLIVAGGLVVWSLARMGLSEVEVYPSRGVLLGTATSSVVLAYLLLLGGLARALWKQQGDGAMLSLALLVLAGVLLPGLVFLSDRLRHSAILYFSRHFNRPLYDYRTIWLTFRERVAASKDEHDYCRVCAGFLSETLDVLSVTIWQLEGNRKLSFGGSTLLTMESARALLSENTLPPDLINTLMEQEGVLDLDDSQDAWTDARSRLFPSQFKEAGGHQFCVPLRAGGGLVGLLLLGDRVSARAYSAEELDLVHAIAGEISRGLLTLRNERLLLASRELEAFQAMSSFVVHDLKNTVATLSLTLQNFQTHHDNPAFRADALRSFSSCISDITGIIQSLGALRQDLNIQLVESDLNALVRATWIDMGGNDFFPVKFGLDSIPLVSIDPAQIKKVVVNLLLNARDAVGEGGQVRVETSMHTSRRVELRIRDNGGGMDQEFIQTRLFRPFQSTKKRGLGIGMFHARMILQAHYGQIKADSNPGEGTVIRVLLPLSTSQS